MNIGVHINKGDQNLEDAISDNFKDGWTTGQVFLWVPQKLEPVKYDAAKVASLLKLEKKNIWVHSSYLISPWGSAKYNKPLCIKQLKQQAELNHYGGVVFHIPNKIPEDYVKDYKFIIDNKPKGSSVILENKAYKSDNSIAKPEKINEMIDKFIAAKISLADIKLCIDTAHLTSAGIKITTSDEVKDWLKKLKYPDAIKLIHLNGNSSVTTQDIHEVPFSPQDLTWHGQKFEDSGFYEIIKFCKSKKIDCIIECHYQRPENRKLALELLKKINKIF